jgi:hypothetical protein
MGFGYFVYRKNASVQVSTLIGVAVLVGVIIFGLKFSSIYRLTPGVGPRYLQFYRLCGTRMDSASAA